MAQARAKAKAKGNAKGKAKAKAKGKATRAGAKSVRRATAGRTARAADPHVAEVRERINEALKKGRALRREIESRIDAEIREFKRRGAKR